MTAKNKLFRLKGFSLTEIMIVLMIIGILSCCMIPSYHHSLLKSHRLEATLTLENLSLSIEHYYNVHHSYQGATLEKLHIPNISKNGYYQLGIESLKDHYFLLIAAPLSAQAQDRECGSLTLDSVGNQSATGYSANPEQECW